MDREREVMGIGCIAPGEKVKTDNRTYFLDINSDLWSYNKHGVREKLSSKIGKKKIFFFENVTMVEK